jgi:leader peptidase (prepilin peptidase) / N-methyltransferase
VTGPGSELFVPCTAFVVGAVVGSFLNVVIYRLPRGAEGLSISNPKRSHCPNCKAAIRWYDNVPLLSYFLLRARCRACRTPISLRYFGVELLTAVLFAYAAQVSVALPPDGTPGSPWALLLVQLGLLASMVAVTFIDLDHFIIPDKIDKPGMILALVLSPLVPQLHVGHGDLETLSAMVGVLMQPFGLEIASGFGVEAPWLIGLFSGVAGVAIGAGSVYAIGVFGTWLFKKDAMGFGDVKYMGMLGGFIGWKGVLLTLLVGCFTGAAIGLVVRVFHRKSYIPFGPFLSLGALVVLFGRGWLDWVLFIWYPGLIHGGFAALFLVVVPPQLTLGTTRFGAACKDPSDARTP